MTDINVAAVAAIVKLGKMDIAAFPNLADWLNRATSRSAYAG